LPYLLAESPADHALAVFDESESERLPIFDRGEDRPIGIGKRPLLVEQQFGEAVSP